MCLGSKSNRNHGNQKFTFRFRFVKEMNLMCIFFPETSWPRPRTKWLHDSQMIMCAYFQINKNLPEYKLMERFQTRPDYYKKQIKYFYHRNWDKICTLFYQFILELLITILLTFNVCQMFGCEGTKMWSEMPLLHLFRVLVPFQPTRDKVFYICSGDTLELAKHRITTFKTSKNTHP